MRHIVVACAVVAIAGCGRISGEQQQHQQILDTATTYPAAYFTLNVYAADVTGDGHVDLFVSSASLPVDAVSVLAGDGTGHFAPPMTFDTLAPAEMVSGDFNGDGATDIVAVNNDGMGALRPFLLQGDGAGGFTGSPIETVPYYWSGSIGTADFTGDGLPDLVLPYQIDSPPGGGVAILAAPDFHLVTDVPMGNVRFSTFVAVGDLDHDGHPDVLVTTTQGTAQEGQIAVLLGDGAGHLGAPTFSPAALTNTRPVLADFNHDGALDVAMDASVNIPAPERVAVLLGDGHGGFGEPASYATGLSSHYGARGLSAGYLDGDHTLDLVVGSGADHLTVLHGNGQGGFTACDHLALPLGEAWGVVAADLNGDGRDDVASVTTDVPVAVFLNH